MSERGGGAEDDDSSHRRLFELRLNRSWDDPFPMLERVYGHRSDLRRRLVAILERQWRARPDDLKWLDLQRDLEPDWFQRPDRIGYVHDGRSRGGGGRAPGPGDEPLRRCRPQPHGQGASLGPEVFLEMVDIMLSLANRGVDVLRFDAVAFMWKRLGTRCQSEPEVHVLLQALRAATRIAAPAVIHLEEAIVGPAEMISYLGVGEHAGREGNLAYHNSLMVRFWSALASRDSRLMTHVLGTHFPPSLPNATYATYLRCHDDIGWAVTDADAGRGPEGVALAGLRRILERRRATPELHGANPTEIVETGRPGVFGFARRPPTGAVVCLFNLTEHRSSVSASWVRERGAASLHDALTDQPLTPEGGGLDGELALPPYAGVWLR